MVGLELAATYSKRSGAVAPILIVIATHATHANSRAMAEHTWKGHNLKAGKRLERAHGWRVAFVTTGDLPRRCCVAWVKTRRLCSGCRTVLEHRVRIAVDLRLFGCSQIPEGELLHGAGEIRVRLPGYAREVHVHVFRNRLTPLTRQTVRSPAHCCAQRDTVPVSVTTPSMTTTCIAAESAVGSHRSASVRSVRSCPSGHSVGPLIAREAAARCTARVTALHRR